MNTSGRQSAKEELEERFGFEMAYVGIMLAGGLGLEPRLTESESNPTDKT